ncbi:hypothetical protein FOZ62_029894, partial [Perkinsus olseni]
ACRPVIEAGHYEGRVNSIGTLHKISMDVSLEGLDGTTPHSTMTLSGVQLDQHLKVTQIGELIWEELRKLWPYQADLGARDARTVDQCYYPRRVSETDKQKLWSSYKSFSIPLRAEPRAPSWNNIIRLCSVSGSWYLFLGRRSSRKRGSYILMYPVLMQRANVQRSLRQPSWVGQVPGNLPQVMAREMILVTPIAAVDRLDVAPTEEKNFPFSGVEPESEASSPTPLVRAPLPAGSLLNYKEAGSLHTVCLTLGAEDSSGHLLGTLTMFSTASEASNESSRYFRFQSATEGTPAANVLALPEMRLVMGGCDGCYIFTNPDSERQDNLHASLKAAGRAFGINNLTLNSIALRKTGNERGHNLSLELRLGTETTNGDQPDLTVRLRYVHPPISIAGNVIESQSRSARAPQSSGSGEEADRGRKRLRLAVMITSIPTGRAIFGILNMSSIGMVCCPVPPH